MKMTAGLLLLAGSLASCSAGLGLRGVHPASLQHATNAVAVAFDINQIPVQVLDDANGFVSSGGFVIEQVWGPEPIEQRVYCGVTEDGTPRARLGPVRMSIEARLSPSNDALATGRAGASVGRRPTEVTLRADGEVRYSDESHGCRLTESFGRKLLAAAGVNIGSVIDVPGGIRVIADGGH